MLQNMWASCARREARGADFGDSARRESQVRASPRLGQPCLFSASLTPPPFSLAFAPALPSPTPFTHTPRSRSLLHSRSRAHAGLALGAAWRAVKWQGYRLIDLPGGYWDAVSCDCESLRHFYREGQWKFSSALSHPIAHMLKLIILIGI